MKEAFLEKKLEERKNEGALRKLSLRKEMMDFCSNDYLGLAGISRNNGYYQSQQLLLEGLSHGSTGSRLLSGNSVMAENIESMIASFHDAPAALLFNSGYDANTGLLSVLGKKGDYILYDKLSHASIRDGIRLGYATAWPFEHNSIESLISKLKNARQAHLNDAGEGEIFVVTESVFSMDGDIAPLVEMVEVCDRYGAHLVVDEAHALGIIGERGEGCCQSFDVHAKCMARIYTYGKAAGAHGAAIVGSTILKEYLLNFARSFIYTTALPPVSLIGIQYAYERFPQMGKERMHLHKLISIFRDAVLVHEKLDSNTAIQGVIVPGNYTVRLLAEKIQDAGFDVRPVMYPSVPKGKERLRIVLHAYNTPQELEMLIGHLQ
ncbi:aminotransferase class I/II-fold pyridoxal phosphate-dependent enzyme [Flavihumibacter sp. ZG627]|uniref:aminotransferase class I/II-fold pyridoxal phosphate-dependent enzyme n=1 Tax=Flavihumibacter sp. ZG627 TaxID=1463156 RepID=UPI00057DD231|nr:aminotransferase class I/II-fold pyridoxal phosphate-dependent enzyme [Flavihumibacter sp. ZG627]KIC89976.1 8-amino-7-oxononanoate synthase [Flavihumibacter sp. ZG627]